MFKIHKSLGAMVAAGLLAVTAQAASAAEAIKIERQSWPFSGFFGTFDKAQLQRGFQVYQEVCSSCHELRRISYRNLAQPGGPEFPEDAVKALAASAQVEDGPDDTGAMFKRPGLLSDPLPKIYANEKEARSIHNGAYPPDLSLMARARNTENVAPWYIHPFLMLRDILVGYQEGGADYIYAILTGYKEPPEGFELMEGMHYNAAFPGHQIAMANPFAAGDGQVQYQDGTPSTVENYARDVAAFLYWTSDPKVEERKRIGWVVILYLIVTSVLLYIAKKRIWSRVEH
ncbi:MAG: cytochrome c1 [Proteobacteria bacterium]|jgi:Cytochrome c1|nr:MAG: cytochrome c1 [Pseudomonadota bacterium]